MFRSKPHQPASALKTIPIAWPFVVWGLDMVGPFKIARGGLTHLLVIVDKFTKWIEAKLVKMTESRPVIDFISGVVHRYGVPHSIITDNGSNFPADEVELGAATWALSLITPLSITPKQTVKSNKRTVLL